VEEQFNQQELEDKRIIERIAQHSKSAGYKTLFDLLDMEIELCRDGLEGAKGDDVIRYQMAITAYRGLKERILSAEHIVEALEADTPE